MRDFAREFYKSGRWLRAREAYRAHRMLIDGGFCEECHEKLIFIIHHRIPLSPENIDDPDITLSFSNLEGVCRDCHDKFEGHGVNKKELPLLLFDEDGEPVAVRKEDNGD